MAFDGLRKIFNRIGGVTLNSGKKVGEGVQKPVGKLSNIKPPARQGSSKSSDEPSKSLFDSSKSLFRSSKSSDEPSKSLFDSSKSLFRSSKSSNKPSKTSPRVIERMKMDKDEIQMFKELIDKKYDRKDEKSDEEKAKRDVYKKAALEEILKEEEKEGMDPKLIMGMGAVSFVVILVLMTALGFGIEIGLIFGLLMFLMAGVILFLPKIQKGKKSSEASRELPFALRQMATELRAGLGLHESMRSIALSGYGALSEEFARTLEEIKYGETTENALLDMSERVGSEGMKRAVYQITRTLSSGGDLSRTLNVIAEDIAYDLRMKLKDYAQKLNSFTMIYMFIAVLGPVIIMIMLIAATTVMGPILPPIVLLIMYLFLFPMVVAFMAFMIKRLEPQI